MEFLRLLADPWWNSHEHLPLEASVAISSTLCRQNFDLAPRSPGFKSKHLEESFRLRLHTLKKDGNSQKWWSSTWMNQIVSTNY